MITVAGRIPIQPEMRELAVRATRMVTQATQMEAGCLQYHFYADLNDPNMFHVFEEWESLEALTVHLQQPHTVEFLSTIGGMAAGPPQVKRYTVSESVNLL
jgi:quinol monooxygenase YgiN